MCGYVFTVIPLVCKNAYIPGAFFTIAASYMVAKQAVRKGKRLRCLVHDHGLQQKTTDVCDC